MPTLPARSGFCSRYVRDHREHVVARRDVVGGHAGGGRRRRAAAARQPVRFLVSASTISGVSFFRKPSFCDAITSPRDLELAVENSFIASALPVAIAMKSASLISSVHAALPTAPSCTAPGGVFRSIVHALSGPDSLNRNVGLHLLGRGRVAADERADRRGRCRRCSAPRRRAAAGRGRRLRRPSAWAAPSRARSPRWRCTTSSRSLTLQRKTIFVSPSFHISVTSVSPGNTLSAKRTLMLLK